MATGQSRISRLVLPIAERDHTLGAPNAPFTLVEYGDYECSYCGAAHPIVKDVVSRRPGQVLADARPALREPGGAGRP